MDKKTFSRGDFIKLSALGLGSLPLRSFKEKGQWQQPRMMRVSGSGNIKSVSIHKAPDEDSVILYQRAKDDIINVYEEVESEFGPVYNQNIYRF